MSSENIYTQVTEHYNAAAQTNDHEYGATVAKEFGYSAEELRDIPLAANLGLSCGNPHALANLKEGETVCDLGSGAGFDVFLAAKKVGEHGKAIGIDMNQDMLRRANKIKQQTGASNTLFMESRISHVALDDGIADCVISNCVINLVPDEEKAIVFKEMFRLLKPGGRVAISDILAKAAMPDNVRTDMELYVGCIAGASQVAEYERFLHEAGFGDVLIVDTKSDLNVYKQGGSSACCGPACCSNNSAANNVSQKASSRNMDYNQYAGSFKIFALKR